MEIGDIITTNKGVEMTILKICGNVLTCILNEWDEPEPPYDNKIHTPTRIIRRDKVVFIQKKLF